MMKFSTSMLAGLGLIAAAGLMTPASAASTGMSEVGGAAKQSMPAGSAQSGSAAQASGARSETMSPSASTMSPAADASSNRPANMSQQSIMQLQQALNGQGEKVSSDGQWGPGTESALKHFQQKNGLPVTGQLDDATRTKLNLKG